MATKKPKVASDGTFGFDDWSDLVDPARVGAEIIARLPEAHERVGQIFKREATSAITTDKAYAANAPATVAIKGSDTPLQDRGRLIGGLGYEILSPEVVRLGVGGSPKTSKGKLVYQILHEGWEVHDPEKLARMRRALWAKIRAGKGMNKTKFKALSETLSSHPAKTSWKMPARPYLSHIFNDPVFLHRAFGVYRKMLADVFTEH